MGGERKSVPVVSPTTRRRTPRCRGSPGGQGTSRWWEEVGDGEEAVKVSHRAVAGRALVLDLARSVTEGRSPFYSLLMDSEREGDLAGSHDPKVAGGTDDAFRVWSAGQPQSPNHRGSTGATIKLGPKVCKTVQVRQFGDSSTGEIKKRELRFSKFNRVGGGFDFTAPAETWHCENEEIERVLAFLNQDVKQPGRYRVIDAASPIADLIEVVRDRPDDVGQLVAALGDQMDLAALGSALARSEAGITTAEAAVIAARRELLAAAIDLARRPDSTETQMHALIADAWWLFGGRYVGIVPRRDLLQLDQHDIPLVRADGSLHIVELKGPNIPTMIRRHRNHWIVGNAVHEAAMQATNYVRTADELGAGVQRNVREELGIEVDLRRVFATVVLGHRDHADAEGMPPEQFDVTLRTYNAVLNRVEVVTFDQLFDAADRGLRFDVV
jgi:hypothetical protein